MASQSAIRFAMRLAGLFEMPKSGENFLSEFAITCDGFTSDVYDLAYSMIRDSRKYRSMPMPAEAREACLDRKKYLDEINNPPRRVHENPQGDWSPDAAFEFCRKSQIARQAASEGWIGPLVSFIRHQKRLPSIGELMPMKIEHQKFEDAFEVTLGAGFASYLRPLGEAMMKRSADWAALILDRPRLSVVPREAAE